MGNVDLVLRLSEVTVQTLLIHGRHDAIRPMSDSEFLNLNIAGSRLVPFENAGHVPTLTPPASVAAEIEPFFT
jgi:pimeloyl-ACP methyl ester carboxylesterase